MTRVDAFGILRAFRPKPMLATLVGVGAVVLKDHRHVAVAGRPITSLPIVVPGCFLRPPCALRCLPQADGPTSVNCLSGYQLTRNGHDASRRLAGR
jgi:hypothetical protein